MKNQKDDIAEKQRRTIKLVMAKHGLNVLSWTNKAGFSEGTLRNFLNGASNAIGSDKLELLANAIGLSLPDLFAGEGSPIPMVKEVGYVGAGMVYAYDDHAMGDGLDEHPCPRGYENTDIVAVRVRGESMRPMLRDGYLLFYTRDSIGVQPECINEVCIVKLHNDGMAVREIKQGSKPGLFHLLAYNGEATMDTKIEWAAKIIEYRPR